MENPSVGSEGGGLSYFLKWQAPVCALIIAIPTAIAASLVKKRLSSDSQHPLNFNHLWVPCWKKLYPRWVLFYRTLAFFTMAWIFYEMFRYSGYFGFYFYTQWTFALVMFYFVLGIIISAQGCFKSSENSHINSEEGENFVKDGLDGTNSASLYKHNSRDESPQRAGFLGNLMHMVYQTAAGASVLTDLVFWTILVPMMAGKKFQLTLLIGSVHSVNAIFLVIDSLLNALPFELFGFNYFILWSGTYVTFQWILHACGVNWWPYPFLELATPWAPLWYLGLAVIHVPCYGVYILLVKAKNAVFSKLFPQSFVRPLKRTRNPKKAD